uniref:C-type lectin domain-containing protein n=1 Tax=Neogobius melanostomus TaxID=47308 RepID=A0A8C6T562_9GOBI
MSTQFHNEADEEDNSTFWNKDPVPARYSFLTRSRRWLVPALVLAVVLVLVLAFGVNSAGLSSRISSQEDTVSNLSLSLSSARRDSVDTAKDVQRLRFSVESNKDQLSSVAESLKELAMVQTLSKAVASLRCAVDRLIHNRTDVKGCCPLEWESVESSCFYFSRASLNWHDARDWCHAHQSQLLILTDDKDWDYMRSHVGDTFYWVGLTDEGGKWEWVNGTPYTIDRRRWMPGQPDNWAGHGFGPGPKTVPIYTRTGG